MAMGKMLAEEMENISILDSLVEVYNLFKNDKRKQIVKVIAKKECNMHQLSKKIKLSYRNTIEHVKLLEKHGFIQTKPLENERGAPLMVYPTEKTILQVYKTIEKDIKKKLASTS